MSSKPTVLREKLKEATAQEILTAAESELAEKGLSATSMQAIAQRAGVSVGTLYNYFRDKKALLASLLADRRQLFSDLMNDAMNKSMDLSFEDQLESVVTAIFQIFESQRNFLQIVLENEKPNLPSKDKAGTTPAQQFVDRLIPLIQKGLDAGILDPRDSDLYPATLASLMRGVMLERLLDRKRPFREATPFVLRMFLNGAKKSP